MSDAMTRALGTTTPTTLDRAARTVEVIALSGAAPALRPAPAPDGAAAPWIEELDAAGADLSRFIGGPALKDHVPTVDATVGVVASASVRGDQIVASLRFADKPAADLMIADVAGGFVRGVSLGYRVQRWAIAGDRGGIRVFRAAAWTPYEISFTPTPVDHGAVVRSTGGVLMSEVVTTVTATPPADATATRAAINLEIRTIGRVAGMDQAWIDGQIDACATADHARADAFAALAKRGSAPINNASTITVGTDYTDPTVMRRSMADALAHRLAPGRVKIEGTPAEKFRGHGALSMLGQLLAARGETVNPWDREALLTRAIGSHSTSDFPLLLADAANKSLLAQYAAAAPTYRSIAAPKPFSDFKPAKFLRLGDFPAFKNLAEGGEPQYGTISENRETVTPAEFATGIVIGRKALINDDLSALGDFSSMIAIRAAQFENSTVYGLLASNGPTLSDTKSLFHADHGNKAASGTTIANGIDAAVQAIRAMTGLDGAKLNLRPRYLVVGPAQEANARRILAAINPTQSGDVNPWAGQFELIVDAEISGNRWLLVAEPAQVPTLVYGYVNGSAGPQILTERDFNTQAIKVRAGLDFAAGVIDFRGIYSNAGA